MYVNVRLNMDLSPANATKLDHGQATQILCGCIRGTFEWSHVESLQIEPRADGLSPR